MCIKVLGGSRGGTRAWAISSLPASRRRSPRRGQAGEVNQGRGRRVRPRPPGSLLDAGNDDMPRPAYRRRLPPSTLMQHTFLGGPVLSATSRKVYI